jgi:hypothetical protein
MTPSATVKPVGIGHNAPHMRCNHWALYRLTCAEYEDLRAFAGGICGICKTPEADTKRGMLVIDHFHGHGRGWFIRGMLCDWCNTSVMQCLDGIKAWGPRNRPYEATAREYEANSWEQPSEEALRQMAGRTEMPRKGARRGFPDRSRLNAIAIPARQGVPAMAERLRYYLTPEEIAGLVEALGHNCGESEE